VAPRDAAVGPRGPEDYPFDPTAQLDQLCGLERLRGIADRKLAADLFTLFLLAERNSGAQAASPSPQVPADGDRRLAARAMAGELGAEARELAEYFLLDDAGSVRRDKESLHVFARGLRALRDSEAPRRR
jgi:hypothetical protein